MLTTMDRASRAQWQAAAAGRRLWYAAGGTLRLQRSRSVVADVRFSHNCLLLFAKRGDVFDPYWWA